MTQEPEATPNKPVRITDIAKEAGVSYPVASLALAGKKDRNVRYGEDTRERVLAVAERLGYRLNRSARNFAQGRHGSLAIIAQSVYQFSRITLNALTLAAMQRDLTVFLDLQREGELPRCIKEDMADGVVILGPIPQDLDEALDRVGIPTVRVNTNRTEGNGVIAYDEREGMRLLVEAFAKRGRRRVVQIHVDTPIHSPTIAHYSNQMRHEELIVASKAHGLEPPRVLHVPLEHFRNDTATLSADDHLDADAFILPERYLPKFYHWCIESRLRVGQDVSILCYQPDWIAQLLTPSCGGVMIDDFAIGELTLTILDNLLAGKSAATRVVPYEYVPGNSL